jgi:ribonuclease E
MKKEMLINVLQPEECRIAILEDGVLEELYVERTSNENYTGNIYKGRVVNIEPAIQAVFVDFSVGRNGFLHVSDVEPQYYKQVGTDEGEAPPRGRAREGARAAREEPPTGPRGRRDRDRDRERPGRRAARGDEDRPHRGEDEPVGRLPAPEMPPRLEDFSAEPESDSGWDIGWRKERPDRSEKPRRERSSRRFGEGLTDDEDFDEPAPAPAPQPVGAPEESAATEAAWVERGDDQGTPSDSGTSVETEGAVESGARDESPGLSVEESWPTFGGDQIEVFIEEEVEGELPPSSPEAIEAELPPSRTARPRRQRSAELPSGPRTVPTEPRRGRERRRPAAGRDLPPAASDETFPEDVLPAAQASQGEVRFEADLEELEDPPRRRGGGRDAIRARGGDRPAGRPRDRESRQAVERGPAPAAGDRAAGGEAAGGYRRGPAHGRAGEPGYVPRRERAGAGDRPEGFEPDEELPGRALPRRDESDLEFEDRPVARGPGEFGGEPEGEDEEGRDRDGRRRRRRRRRRGPELPSTGETSARPEVDRPARKPVPPRGPRAGGYGAPEELSLIDEDFDERGEDREEDQEDYGAETGAGLDADLDRIVDEDIDPELEEEIRREIEEIQALEREMGLRGTTEARPRRGEELEPARGARGRGLIKPPIQEIFRRGEEVLVQVIKESIGTKGPTLSTYISIPGRYLVLMPGLNRVGVSRKIADEGQRRRLREIMHALNPPKGLGFIVRTAGLDRTKRELARDLAYLLRLWKVILRRIKKAKAPAPIYQESDMIIRTIRDIFTSEIDVIWIDERNAFERAQEFMRVVMPKFVDRIKYFEDKVPLFHKYGLEDEIARIQRRRVDLAGGGSIVIDQTEALVAIDVNSGNFRVEDDAERTAYEMNLRAAKEIARQLRLRDLGGVIVNDFIDMRDERHRRGVERAIREAVRRDRARTKILRMSQFGLIEMTRQRIRPSLKRSVYEDCLHCGGAGVAKTAESMAIDVMRLLALAANRGEVRRVNVCVSAAVETYLNNRKRQEIARLESECNLAIQIRHQDAAPAEHLQIECFDAQNNEVRLFPPAVPQAPRRGR